MPEQHAEAMMAVAQYMHDLADLLRSHGVHADLSARLTDLADDVQQAGADEVTV